MRQWERQKQWSDKFLPEIKRILGEYLIAEPPIEEDAERNTDLTVLRLDAIRIGCRIRRYKYVEAFGNEFTIRSGRTSGIKTELTKIIEGWGDYFFYGFADSTETKLCQWILGDLKVLRLYINRNLYQHKVPWTENYNWDNSSSFVSFRHGEIPGFLVAKNECMELTDDVPF